MAVRVYHQTAITCDICQKVNLVEVGRREEIIEMARQYGWKIGRKSTCPDCQKKPSKRGVK